MAIFETWYKYSEVNFEKKMGRYFVKVSTKLLQVAVGSCFDTKRKFDLDFSMDKVIFDEKIIARVDSAVFKILRSRKIY